MDSFRGQEAPELVRVAVGGVTVWTDAALRERAGLVVAFTERGGGVSGGSYESLNLAAHVGDDPRAVDENRRLLMAALGIAESRDALVCAEQVHGELVHVVTEEDAGRGSHAGAGAPPIPETDALVTACPGVPLLMCFADCVPIVLAAETGGNPAVAVVHAGWKGSLAGLPGTTATRLAEHACCTPESLIAYVGPHIGSCCYNVDERRISLFGNTFDTIAAVGDNLDLSAAVRESLQGAGVPTEAIVEAGQCTSDHTERFYSFRTASVTGRHGAIAAIV